MNNNPPFRRSFALLCVFVTIGIGFLHVAVPKDISMFILYLVPILFAAHYLPVGASYAITVLATIVWITAYFIGDAPQNAGIAAWNITVRGILFFSATVYSHVLLSKIRNEQAARKEIEHLHKLANPFSASLLACDQCGKINTPDHKWMPPLTFLRSEAHVEIDSCLCPQCYEKSTSQQKSQQTQAPDDGSGSPKRMV